MSDKRLFMKNQMGILKPLHEVFEAVVDNNKLNKYFVSKGSDSLESNKTITWRWDDYNATHDIKVLKVEKDKYISFNWNVGNAETLTEIFFEKRNDNLTLVKITEKDWSADYEGATHLMGQTEGWTNFLCCLKAYVEHGIDLRAGGVVKE